ncbi:uncharacterized protein SPPG_03401 [Spizellomyces punctatus DAOM BR117]|uniref:Uncharacterized protein n=1 Tax=Spizellomyces punctatus (strain DAOM BR117) TaxID=645134 RepID=A0A0L0HKQ8_SPIPD|nr:uncharacterized protein SPPG_03401 [Spizellomyces punctatus DAOM BR117]KND01603.1 hypothetical protein SPPG_03401 [Spizellomyces punctatus DAOM BR117]|eukprot:XP_016609642.1 hypothetical protein SPPG_03401 [Spizellomyces punctatus DAOM BR117]
MDTVIATDINQQTSTVDPMLIDLDASMTALSLESPPKEVQTPSTLLGSSRRSPQWGFSRPERERRESIALFRAIAGIDKLESIDPFFLIEDIPSPPMSDRCASPDFSEFTLASPAQPFILTQSPPTSPQSSTRTPMTSKSSVKQSTSSKSILSAQISPKPSMRTSMTPRSSARGSTSSRSSVGATMTPQSSVKSHAPLRSSIRGSTSPRSSVRATMGSQPSVNATPSKSAVKASTSPRSSVAQSSISPTPSRSTVKESTSPRLSTTTYTTPKSSTRSPTFPRSSTSTSTGPRSSVQTPAQSRASMRSPALPRSSTGQRHPITSLTAKSRDDAVAAKNILSTPAYSSFTTPSSVFRFSASTVLSPKVNNTPANSAKVTSKRTAGRPKTAFGPKGTTTLLNKSKKDILEMNVDVTISVPPAVEPTLAVVRCDPMEIQSYSPLATPPSVKPMPITKTSSNSSMGLRKPSGLPRASPSKISSPTAVDLSKRKVGDKFEESPSLDRTRLKYSRGNTRLPLPGKTTLSIPKAMPVPSRIARSTLHPDSPSTRMNPKSTSVIPPKQYTSRFRPSLPQRN